MSERRRPSSRTLPPRSPPPDTRQRIEETTRVVVRALRHALDRGHFSVDDAAAIAIVQLLRPGGPTLGGPQQDRLRDAVRVLAKSVDDPTRPRALLHFARACSEAAWGLVRFPRHPGAVVSAAARDVGGAGNPRADMRALARAALYAEATQSKDSDDHVRRAVVRAVREKKRSRGTVTLPLGDDDALRTLLDVPARGRVSLPKTDVRNRIAQAAHMTAFGHALRQAARFSDELIRPAVGEELWSLCRPVGFADNAESKILVEVRSSALAHEVQLRSQELIHRMKQLPGFVRVNAIKLVVIEPKALKVL